MVRASILCLLAASLGACGDEVGLGSGTSSLGNAEGGGAESGAGASMCNPALACAAMISCVNGLLYPTTCGPANCDKAIGPCSAGGGPTDAGASVDAIADAGTNTGAPADEGGNADGPENEGGSPGVPGDAASEAATGGPTMADASADSPSATPPDAGPSCNPMLACLQTLSCINHKLYPTTCGPRNCDNPLGPC
jgi:hypothetical protein